MKNLIGMTDFALEQIEKLKRSEINILQFRNNIGNYANFLKQPLTLGMFVPCDDDGNVLSETYSEKENTKNKTFSQLSNEYQIAKSKVLFEIYSFELERDNIWYFGINEISLIGFEKIGTIENLTEYNLILTQTAQKQLGL